MQLHRLLQRQLKKTGLDSNKLPESNELWQTFLEIINTTYQEQDQDRYLNERSLEISSREMFEFNKQFEDAQNLIHLGYWSYSIPEDSVSWSKEIYSLFGYNPLELPPSTKEFMQRVHKEDVFGLENAISLAVENGSDYEVVFRYEHPDNKTRWFRVIGHPTLPKDKNQKIVELKGVILDLTTFKAQEAAINILNEQLLDTARRAGMSEVATAILHNIGNVLNSVNVAAEIAKENLRTLTFDRVRESVLMIETHLSSATEYLTQDEKGKLILDYLKYFASTSKKINQVACNELDSLTNHIKHMRNIISTQQVFTRVSGLSDRIRVEDAIDEALQISRNTLLELSIIVEKKSAEEIFIVTDKSKLFQILVNLIQNAKDAVIACSNPQKKILLKVEREENQVVISVEDNGVGIPENNLSKIFSFGFTSKKNGNGIGLHSCALAAKELGGSLIAKSSGPNQGATFILTLPINRHEAGGGGG